MPYALLFGGLLILPFAGQWSALVNLWAALTGDPAVSAVAPGTEEWAHRLVFFAAFLVCAAFVWATDRWLSGIVVMAGMQTLAYGERITSVYLLLGVAVLLLMRRAPGALRRYAPEVLGWSAVAQALIVIAQKLKGHEGVGSFGVSGVAACYIAACGLLLPDEIRGPSLYRLALVTLALALIAVAVTLTGSRAGLAAFLVGLAVRYVPLDARLVVALVALALIYGGWVAWRTPPVARNSAEARVNLHALVLHAWARSAPTQIAMGHGLGAFQQNAVTMQRDSQRAIGQSPVNPKYFIDAHDDLLQWLYETGVIGTALLAGWLIRWRRRLAAPPYAPALAVVAVMALAWFPFHDLRTSMLAAGLVGLGTGDACN